MAEVAITDGLVLNWEVDSYVNGGIWSDKIAGVDFETIVYIDNGNGTSTTSRTKCLTSSDGIEMYAIKPESTSSPKPCYRMSYRKDYSSPTLASIGLQNTITFEWIGRIDPKSFSNGGTIFYIYNYSSSSASEILGCRADSDGLFFDGFRYDDAVGNITGLCHIIVTLSVTTTGTDILNKNYVADVTVYINNPTPIISNEVSYKALTGQYNLHLGINDFASYFYGAVNTIRFWNRSLTQEEVNQLFGTKKFYMKQSGSWNAVSDVYKKENGIWVKQTDLSSIFNESYNYIKRN